jgi:glutathione synthase/RimK-type ligase-like ATP-grasp enzyme
MLDWAHKTYRRLVGDVGRYHRVYYRRPHNFNPTPHLSAADRLFAMNEARSDFGGLLACLPARWVNHPFHVADTEFKPGQLSAARKCGLRVPATLITNDGNSARSFAGHHPYQTVYKPCSTGFYRDRNDNLALIYTTRVSAELFRDNEIAATSHVFQHFVDKLYDVRVTVVGTQMFATAIYSSSQQGRVDWRSDYDSLRYSDISIPEEVTAGIARYLAHYNLPYGAFDFSVDRDGYWWFLECNPNGQWGFIAEATGAPIASAIADVLLGECLR